MPNYNHEDFDPPAPMAWVDIRNPHTGQTLENVPMLIDTGADVTLVPQVVLDHLRLTTSDETAYELVGFSGERQTVTAVQLELLFCRKTFRGQFLPLNQAWGILGRNVLNVVALHLNGPQLQWEEMRNKP